MSNDIASPQKTGQTIEAVSEAMGWDVSEAMAAFANLKEQEARWQHYYTSIDPRPGQLQIDWFLNFYEMSEAEQEAYACHVRAVLAGTSETAADKHLYAAWGIRPDEQGAFLNARIRKQRPPRPWEKQ